MTGGPAHATTSAPHPAAQSRARGSGGPPIGDVAAERTAHSDCRQPAQRPQSAFRRVAAEPGRQGRGVAGQRSHVRDRVDQTDPSPFGRQICPVGPASDCCRGDFGQTDSREGGGHAPARRHDVQYGCRQPATDRDVYQNGCTGRPSSLPRRKSRAVPSGSERIPPRRNLRRVCALPAFDTFQRRQPPCRRGGQGRRLLIRHRSGDVRVHAQHVHRVAIHRGPVCTRVASGSPRGWTGYPPGSARSRSAGSARSCPGRAGAAGNGARSTR